MGGKVYFAQFSPLISVKAFSVLHALKDGLKIRSSVL